MVVVEVLPFLEAFVEQLGIVDDDAVELPVEPFTVDAVGTLHLPVQPRADLPVTGHEGHGWRHGCGEIFRSSSGAVRITASGKARKAHDSDREGSKGALGLPGSGIDSLLRPGLPSHQQGLWANAFDRDA